MIKHSVRPNINNDNNADVTKTFNYLHGHVINRQAGAIISHVLNCFSEDKLFFNINTRMKIST